MRRLDLSNRRRDAWTTRAIAAVALGLPLACAAAVQSAVDSTSVTLGEPFALTIARDGASSGVQPDLAPLRKDFAVLGTEAASETSIVNGSRSDRVKWIVRLQPLHAGNAEIPAIAVGGDRTAPIELTVVAPSAAARADMSEHAFIESDAAARSKAPYVQQQVPYTVRLFVDGDVQSGSLNPPDAGPDAVVEQVGKETRYAATRQGRDYTVIERHYAISPERSGPLKVSPATFQGTAVVPVAASPGNPDPADDMMARMLRNSPFANDPMFRNGLMASFGGASATRTLAAQGPALSLDVRARPAGAASPWLPAERLTVSDSWAMTPPHFAVGEPVSRVITIEARGIAASQLPTISPTVPGGARVYPEAVDNQSHVDGATIAAVSRQTLTYIPSATGSLDIPALKLAWWDTQADAAREASLPAQHFDVVPGAGGVQTATLPTQATATPATSPSTVADASSARGGWSALASKLRAAATERRWQAGLAALVVALAAAFALLKRRSRPVPTAASPIEVDPEAAVAIDQKLDRKSSLRALNEACRSGDATSAAQALLQLASIEWPADPPRGLGALAARLSVGAAQVAALDRCLYGAQPTGWDGQALWAACKDGLRPLGQREPVGADFEDLYGNAGVAH